MSSKNNRARPSTSTGNQSNSSTHHSLRVRSAVQRHQSPERPILCQICSLMHPKIQRRRVIVNVLHPSCVRPRAALTGKHDTLVRRAPGMVNCVGPTRYLMRPWCGRPDGRLQFSGGGSKMAWLASAFSSIRARCPKKLRRRD